MIRADFLWTEFAIEWMLAIAAMRHAIPLTFLRAPFPATMSNDRAEAARRMSVAVHFPALVVPCRGLT